MNLPTIFVLTLILAGVCVSLRSIRHRKANGCGCSGCAGSCQGCGLLSKPTEK